MDYMNIAEVKKMFTCVADEVIAKEQMLTEIDNIIGDGDHGIGMAIGFRAIKEALPNMQVQSINELFKEIGMTMLDAMGGASGVIFGTMFISGFGVVPKRKYLDIDNLSKMMKKSLENIKQRGKAEIGDKTMIDSYEPAVSALLKSAECGKSLLEGINAAKAASLAGMEMTKTYEAKKGRAESYGQKSIGLPDPGAVSVTIIFSAMFEFLQSQQKLKEEKV